MLHDKRFDDVLLTMAGQAGGVESLLRIFFSFLHRSTDFYVTFDPVKNSRASMGFPEGKAESILLNTFRSFSYKKYNEPTRSPKEVQKVTPVVRRGKTGEVVGLNSSAKSVEKGETGAEVPSTEPPSPSGASSNKKSPITPTSGSGSGINVRYTEDGKQIPIGNGGVTSRYYWTQTLYEASVYADVPAGTRSRDVKCNIGARKLHLSVKGGSGPIIEGQMPGAVSRDGSLWSLVDGNTVVISLEKAQKNWWRSIVEGDPEIDATQVDSTCKISEYNEETQGAIRKIMFDQRQKSLGLPTSDELTADSVLEMAKGLPGSPFIPGGPFADESLNPPELPR
ncbi:unnamed protein product [Choristocarpus tenellus]